MAIARKYMTAIGKKEILPVNKRTYVFAKRRSSGGLE